MRKKIDMKKNKGSKTFDEGYDEFILNCKVRNLRPATIKHYDDIVNHIWYKFIDYKTPTNDITHQTIQQFILFCKEKMNEKDTTINTKGHNKSKHFRLHITKEGIPKSYTQKQLDNAIKMLETNSYTEVVEITGISKSTLIRELKKTTFYKLVKQYEEDGK